MRRGRRNTIVPFFDPATLREWDEGKTKRTNQISGCKEAKRRGQVIGRRVRKKGRK